MKTCSDCAKWLRWPDCPYESFQARLAGPKPDDPICQRFEQNWYRTDEYIRGKVQVNTPEFGKLHPSNNVTLENLDNVFSYHNDDPNRVPHYDAVRSATKELARVILQNVPPCADRSAALRQLRESVMNANAAIALAPEYPWLGLK